MKRPPTHDPRRPIFCHVQDTPQGRELVLALFTKGCLYRRCSFCALPSLSAGDDAVSAEDIKAQVDLVMKGCPARQRRDIRRVTVYNSGSVLDRRTLPSEALWYLFERLADFPALAEVCLDTRAEFVEDSELGGLKARIKGRRLTVAVGYETYDERIRNRVLRKGLSEAAFQRLAAKLAAHKVRLKAYVLIKPEASLSEEQAVKEAVRTLKHLRDTGRRLGLEVEAHLNPTYVARGSILEKEFRLRHYQPPRLWSVVDIVSRLEGQGLAIHIGLDTEGLAVRGGTFRNCGLCDRRVRAALRAFSSSQDYGLLKGLQCRCRAAGSGH
jgi:radical SAM enzyme (TIGR01210 family)